MKKYNREIINSMHRGNRTENLSSVGSLPWWGRVGSEKRVRDTEIIVGGERQLGIGYGTV